MSQAIRRMFAELPQTYEFLNHVLTFGQDILWRRKAARAAAAAGGTLWLDACGGTGEIAMCLSRLVKDSTRIVVADFSLPMMTKAMQKSQVKHIEFTLADVGYLPFQDELFDAIIMSFASRELNSDEDGLLKCFREFHRILKPDGKFVNLDTSQPRLRPIRWMFHLYGKLIVVPIGRMVSGSDTAYTYLSHSMCNFYSPEELAKIIKEAGFSEVRFNRLLLGAAAIHKGIK